MRLIYAEPIEKFIEDGLNNPDKLKAFGHDAIEILSEIHFAPTIDPESLRPKGEWISVDDRLPEVTGKYVCCVKEKGGNTWTIPADWSLEMKMWFGEFGEIKNVVTHWMPLPEPPNCGADMRGNPNDS